MSYYSQLKNEIGTPCWLLNGIFELRKKSDARIVSVDKETVTIETMFGKQATISMTQIATLVDKR